MKITYDSEVDALYIKFREGQCTTKEIGDGIALDVDDRGVVGIEMLDFMKLHGDRRTLRQIIVEGIDIEAHQSTVSR